MPGISLEQFNTLVEALYRSSLDPNAWQNFLAMLSRHVGGVWTGLHAHDYRANINIGFLAQHWDPEYVDSYRSEYAGINPWNAAVRRARIGVAQTSESLVDPQELRRSRFYNEWVRPQEDIGTGAGITIHRTPTNFMRMSCNIRMRDRDRLQGDLVRLLNLLAPHLRRAFVITHHMTGQRLGTEMLVVLETVSAAVVLLDARGRWRHGNRRAEGLCASGIFAFDRNGRAGLRDPDANAALARALDAIEKRRYVGLAGAFDIRGPNGGRLSATIAPFAQEDPIKASPFDGFYRDRPIAILCIVDPSERGAPREVDLQRTFGLTPAEAALAIWLYEGGTLRAFAETRRIKVDTARKQLASAFEKTGTSQQSQLVARMAKAGWGSPEPSDSRHSQ